MSDNSEMESVDLEYYFNKKSKYFEEMKEKSEYERISVNQFLTFLSIAYNTKEIADEQLLQSCLNSNCDWTKITRSELFSELLDVNEKSLYNVIRETNIPHTLNINKEYEVFNDCNYFFSIPSGTTLTLSSDSLEVNNSTGDVRPSSEIYDLKDTYYPDNVERSCLQKRKNFSGKLSKPVVSVSNEYPLKSKGTQLKLIDTRSVTGSVFTEKSTEQYRNKNFDPTKKLNRKQLFLSNIKNNTCKKVSSLSQLNLQKPSLANKREKQKPLQENESTKKLNCKTKLEVKTVDENPNDNADKKIIKNFQSPQKFLEAKLANFMETTEIQNLKDAAKNIQCDSNILEWISQWLISRSPQERRIHVSNRYSPVVTCPSLDPTIVVPVLVSASVIQINSLVELCLRYCKNNMNEILKTDSDLSCINDTLLSRLSNMYSNVDVEALKDKDDKIRSYFYTQLILSLSYPEPQPWKGHFSSLANIFKCIHCKKLVLLKIANTIPCLEKNMQVSQNGKILSLHDRDPDWNLTEYIGNLRTELKCWRRVYWRLWAECHFLYCTSCRTHYSVYMYKKCYYHPECPTFSSLKEISYAGHYPCCGLKAYKYECICFPEKGCRLKIHSPLLKNNRASTDIMKLFKLYQPLMFSSNSESNSSLLNQVQTESVNTCDKNKTKSYKNKSNSLKRGKWKVHRQNSTRKRKGLMNKTVRKGKNRFEIKKPVENYHDKLIKAVHSSETNNDASQRTQSRSSMRFNQDNQRIHEECIMKTVNATLTRRISCHNALSDLTKLLSFHENANSNKAKLVSVISDANTNLTNSNSTESVSLDSVSSLDSSHRIHHSRNTSVWNSYNPLAGSYIRIESEWKDTHNIPLNLIILPNQFSSPSMNAKLNNCSQSKSCSRCYDQNINWNKAYSLSRKNTDLPSVQYGTEDESRIWMFDARSQELDYLSAAYRPVAIKKEHRYQMRHLKLDWDNLIGVERYWSAFLGLFFEYENTPN